MIYVLTEWDGRGSGSPTLETSCLKEARAKRECTLTFNEAKKKYGDGYFFKNDVKCSTIDIYSSEKKKISGIPKKTKEYF